MVGVFVHVCAVCNAFSTVCVSVCTCLSVGVSDDACPNTFTEAVVTFDYNAHRDDELTLRVGQVLTNVCAVEEGWAEELLRKVGMFPANFVEMRRASPDDRPPPPIPKENCPPPPVDEEGRYISSVCDVHPT